MDLISREAVTDIIQKEMESVTDYLQHDVLINVEFEVCELPTVEAKEVVHGEWIAQDEGQTRFMCSNCEKKNYGGHERFCPYCGCDMRISTE